MTPSSALAALAFAARRTSAARFAHGSGWFGAMASAWCLTASAVALAALAFLTTLKL